MKSIVNAKRMQFIPIFGLFFLIATFSSQIYAQVLADLDGNGIVRLVALGDSITAGLGDALAPGADVPSLEGSEFGEGYPGRLSRYFGVPVENEGIPGEELVASGIYRLPSELNSSQADTMILYEGVNDSINKISAGQVGRVVQRAANVCRSSGKNLVLVTLPQPCCNHAGREAIINAYDQEIRNVAAINSLPLADLAKAWETTCRDREECELYNLPEGLHPNKLGYDVIAQTMAASILGIDIFAPDGATKLAAAIGVPVENIKVRPAVVM